MEIPRHWRLKAQRYRLVGSTCPVCGRLTFASRPVCTQCHCTAQQMSDRHLRNLGIANIESYRSCHFIEWIIG
jgi:uncharacterized OB-fold protein